jgi:hypothetical protein
MSKIRIAAVSAVVAVAAIVALPATANAKAPSSSQSISAQPLHWTWGG